MISSLVLVVEDDEEIASLLEKYLVRAGYRTTKAPTGLTALAHVQRLQPDLILLDIGLPDIDRFDLLAKVRRNSTVPVIFKPKQIGFSSSSMNLLKFVFILHILISKPSFLWR